MILEHAVLSVIPARTAEFEAAFERARGIISQSPGFEGLTLSRCLEQQNRYLLLVQWQELADHVEGFRGSTRYAEWKSALHHFYDPFPTVDHYQKVLSA